MRHFFFLYYPSIWSSIHYYSPKKLTWRKIETATGLNRSHGLEVHNENHHAKEEKKWPIIYFFIFFPTILG